MGNSKRKKFMNEMKGTPQFDEETGVLDVRQNRKQDIFVNLPSNLNKLEYMEYIRKNWELFTAFAYSRYLEEGKGALICDWDGSFMKALSSTHDCPWIPTPDECHIAWLNAATIRILISANLFGEDWNRLLDNYVPDLMVIVCLSSYEGMMTRTLSTMPFPKESYLKNRGRLSEFETMAVRREDAK
ncbi:hypothetical protein CAL7716_085310 [Calothrix sp. PCC 7716]|nr:hypothetical protein CAL7716_085310 [Calothrix sp. PCC 7716]